jgi:DNA (cytosine-5)-methyltransferase 3A
MKPMGLFGYLESIIKQPKDKGILLKDILESEVDEKYFVSNKMINKIKRTNNGERCFTVADKSLCLKAGYYKQGSDNQYIVASRKRNIDNPKSRQAGLPAEQMLEPRYDGKTNCLTRAQKDNYVVCHNSMPISSKTGKGVGTIRRLTPVECERLQTVKDNYTKIVSDTQRYKMLGNGWTVDVIAYILSYGEWL